MTRRLLIWSLKDIKTSIERMTSTDVKFDCIIFIEGNRGLGKSTLGYKLLSGLKVENPFVARRDLVYSREDTLKHLASKINGCIFSDEMINVAYKRDFYQEEQKDLLKGFDMYRDSRNVFIGCIPKFVDLDSKIQKVCKLRLSVLRRGLALVQMQNPTIYSQDPWDVRNNQKIESKWSLKGSRNPRYGQLTTVRGILMFGDLTEKQRVEYDKIKFEKRNHVFKKYSDQGLLTDPEQLFLKNLIDKLKEGNITPKRFDLICNINGKDINSVRRKINSTLKEEGDPKRWRDYCLSKKAKKRKDQLGFSIPKPIDIDIQTNKNEPIEVDIKVSNNEEKGQDIFGFGS